MEKLYNGIILPDNFPKGLEPSDASNVPYLENPPEVIDVSVGRQLFVDDFLIESTTLGHTYHKAKKFGTDPIFKAETEWEKAQSPVACPKSGGIWYDEDEHIFKMWYEAGWLRNMCYATSKDGLNWERPLLDIVEGTNLILKYDGFEMEKLNDKNNCMYLRPDSTTVVIDYDTNDKSQRYKLFMRNPGGSHPGIAAVSADGIHFEKFRFTEPMYDRSTVFYNPFRKKWVYSIRAMWKGRTRSYRECDDYLEGAKWSAEDEIKWMSTDSLDLPDPYIGFAPQLYNVDAVGYESIMLGMFQIMYGPENNICESRGVPKITELIPMYSRDGYHFSRPCRDSIISASRVKGAWDRGYVQSVGGVTVIRGDELWIYYIGFGGDENYSNQTWFTNGIYRNGATGLAKLRRDGFVSMDGDGTLKTRRITFDRTKKRMLVNYSGSISAELYTDDGQLLASSKVLKGDSTCEFLDFGDFDIESAAEQVLRVKFNVNGSLYSFGFSDENGDCKGAHAAGIVK